MKAIYRHLSFAMDFQSQDMLLPDMNIEIYHTTDISEVMLDFFFFWLVIVQL